MCAKRLLSWLMLKATLPTLDRYVGGRGEESRFERYAWSTVSFAIANLARFLAQIALAIECSNEEVSP